MTRVRVEAGTEARELDLEVGEAALLGREPTPDRLASGPWTAATRINAVSLAARSVSANHCVVWRDDSSIRIQDLGSRNGSWMRLAPHTPVALGADTTLSLQLAGIAVERAGQGPADASWKERDEFAAAVVDALQAWLTHAGVSARVTVSARRAGADDPAAGRIPLANGHVLSLISDGTQDAAWDRVLREAWTYVTRQNQAFELEESARTEGLILASRAIRDAHMQVIAAAQRGARLLLVGPSGAGKEGLARAYHRHARLSGPFVARNCSIFSREFLISQLFGAEPGAFTGCVQRIVGAVERAHSGTLFLDEVGDMPTDVQPMLLRFLDSGEFERMGNSGQTRKADVRIVSATNKDLRSATQRGEFRADLWYRLSIHVVEVPPLSERIEDVLAYLQSRFISPRLTAYAALSPSALDMVSQHPWHGNFRELANFVERLPSVDAPSAIDDVMCRRALDAGALAAPTRRPARPRANPPRWAELALEAASAFESDMGGEPPSNWDEVKEYIEKYLKPLLFAHLSGASDRGRREDVELAAVASALDADRGTALKHIARYFERFATNARASDR